MATPSSARQGSQISEAFGKLYGQSRYGSHSDGLDSSKPHGSIHENCINCIVPLKKSGDSKIKRFSTSGLDGKVVMWDVSNDEDLAEYM